jgi:hypothetical protein
MSGNKPEKFHWGMQALSGSRISKDEAGQLEDRLKADPLDFAARASLLGYYSAGRAKSKAAQRRRIEHILWVIENAPDRDLGKTPCLYISKNDHPDAFEKARALILLQCENFKTNPEVLADLGCMIKSEDMETAETILRRACSISKKKDRIAFWLSHVLHRYGQQQNDSTKLAEAVTFMQEVVDKEKPSPKFDYRFWLAKMALDSEQIELATTVSEQMLADNVENNESVHVAHIVLGRIAFSTGDTPSAVEHLLQAGKVGSSPRLCSYGPMMKLAQDLLETGQRAPVIQYLRDCKAFWEMGKRKLPKWIREIELGETPTLQGDDW